MLNRSTQRSAANYFAMSMLFKFSMTWDSLELWDNWAWILLPFRITSIQVIYKGIFGKWRRKWKCVQSADDSDEDVNALPTVAAISS